MSNLLWQCSRCGRTRPRLRMHSAPTRSVKPRWCECGAMEWQLVMKDEPRGNPVYAALGAILITLLSALGVVFVLTRLFGMETKTW